MLNDLTLLMCVPSFLCIEAQRTHKKTPRFQLAHPGLFAPQSAHRSLPGIPTIKSCNARSLRACWRLLTAGDAIVEDADRRHGYRRGTDICDNSANGSLGLCRRERGNTVDVPLSVLILICLGRIPGRWQLPGACSTCKIRQARCCSLKAHH